MRLEEKVKCRIKCVSCEVFATFPCILQRMGRKEESKEDNEKKKTDERRVRKKREIYRIFITEKTEKK